MFCMLAARQGTAYVFCTKSYLYLETVDLNRPLTDRHEICTQVWCGVQP